MSEVQPGNYVGAVLIMVEMVKLVEVRMEAQLEVRMEVKSEEIIGMIETLAVTMVVMMVDLLKMMGMGLELWW